MTDTTADRWDPDDFADGPKPCPTCGASFPTPASHGVITCANGHGWTAVLASTSAAGPEWGIAPAMVQDERDHAAADQAHRDDLARDVSREWRKQRAVLTAGRPIPAVVDLAAALDRLAAAYGTGE